MKVTGVPDVQPCSWSAARIRVDSPSAPFEARPSRRAPAGRGSSCDWRGNSAERNQNLCRFPERQPHAQLGLVPLPFRRAAVRQKIVRNRKGDGPKAVWVAAVAEFEPWYLTSTVSDEVCILPNSFPVPGSSLPRPVGRPHLTATRLASRQILSASRVPVAAETIRCQAALQTLGPSSMRRWKRPPQREGLQKRAKESQDDQYSDE